MPLIRARRPAAARISTPLRVKGEALTAAGYRVRKRDAELMMRLRQAWQARAFAYYDIVPELKFASQFYARMLEPLRIFPTKLDDKGEWIELTHDEAKTADDETAVAMLERFQDPGGGREGLQGSYGRLMFIAGETILLSTRDDETDIEQWEMLSTDELRIQNGVYLRYKAPSILVQEYREPEDKDYEPLDQDTAIAYRLWKKHPRFSWLPDATMMGVLDVAEELVLLTQAVRSRARSRMAGPGILFLDNRLSPPPAEPVPDEDPQEDPFMADMVAATLAAITDEGSAAAAAPMLARVPVPDDRKLQDLVYHLQVNDPMQLYPETGLRLEAVKRMSIGLDMPPEVLLGLGDSSHWTGWQIEDQTWKAHGLPLAKQFTGDVAASFYRPSLREAGVAEWWRYGVGFDESAIVVHPDRSKDAKDLFAAGELSGEALRRESDFSEDDAPTEEERNRYIGIKIRDGSLAVFGIPSIKPGGIEPEAGEIESPGKGTETAPTTGAEVEPGPPKTSETAPEEALQAAAVRVARLQGAIDLALLRAREAAGNRIVTLVRRDDDLAEQVRGVRTSLIPATLGRDVVRGLRGIPSELELVAGARDLIRDALRMYEITDSAIVDLIVKTVEEHAARTLFKLEPPKIAEAFAAYISGVISGNHGKGSSG